ncbi:MAG TPA: response regulator [Tepidisphaeraceae bacterium]|jgi:FixJ family two-component response regulator
MDQDLKPCVFVVDDDPKILRLVADVLEAEGWTVETFGLAGEFLESYRPSPCACLLLDIQMPGLSGPELQRELLACEIRIPVIFLTATADVPTTIQVMKLGAVDLLQKPFDPEKLVAVVRAVLEREAASVGQRTQVDAVRKRLAQLTPREREVLNLVVAGMANKQIARELNLSERTVEIHRGRVMKKMEADSLANLVHQCLSIGDTFKKSSP